MPDELVSFCIRKGMTKFCKFFNEKQYGTIDNFMQEDHMDQFINDASLDPVEKAEFVERMNEARKEAVYSMVVSASSIIPSKSNQSPAKRARGDGTCKQAHNGETKSRRKHEYDESVYITPPQESYIYDVNPVKTYECLIDRVFYISKYRLPQTWSAPIPLFLENPRQINTCKQLCAMVKAIAMDMYPILANIFIFQIPRHALSGVCTVFVQHYPQLDDVYRALKTKDPENDPKYCRSFKKYIDVSAILKDKLQNKFRNRSYKLKEKNMWPYIKGSNIETRTMGMKPVKTRVKDLVINTHNSHIQEEEEDDDDDDDEDNKEVLSYLVNPEHVLIDDGQEEVIKLIDSYMPVQ